MRAQCGSCHIVRGFIECHHPYCLTRYVQVALHRHVCTRRPSRPHLLTCQFLCSLIPTVFLPIPLLAYASLLGIASTVLLIGVVFVDGLSKFDAPGSLWSPAKTSFGFCNLEELGLAFGLFMAGVCILAVFYNMYTISQPTHSVRRPCSPPFPSSGHG
jgi:hypothetical protein